MVRVHLPFTWYARHADDDFILHHNEVRDDEQHEDTLNDGMFDYVAEEVPLLAKTKAARIRRARLTHLAANVRVLAVQIEGAAAALRVLRTTKAKITHRAVVWWVRRIDEVSPATARTHRTRAAHRSAPAEELYARVHETRAVVSPFRLMLRHHGCVVLRNPLHVATQTAIDGFHLVQKLARKHVVLFSKRSVAR
jgi:hypothetical protein